MITVEIEFDVEFYDTDAMGVVWHGNYIKYFEKSRCALLSKIGYNYNDMRDSGFAFPVTQIDAKYKNPLVFGDRVRARATLFEYENCIKIKYELYNAASGVLTTKGTSTQMAVDIGKRESCFVCPKLWTDKVESLLAQSPQEKAA